MKVAIWLLAAAALVQASPVTAQVSPFGMRLTHKGDNIVGADFEIDIQSGRDGTILTRTSHRLAPDWKAGEAYRFVTHVHQIHSGRCPAALTALQRMETLDLPKLKVLVTITADGGMVVPVPPIHVGRYTLDAPTGPGAGGRVQLSGTVRDPVGVWFMDTMKAIEPCWELQPPPAGPAQ